jgi:hypothetical protein
VKATRKSTTVVFRRVGTKIDTNKSEVSDNTLEPSCSTHNLISSFRRLDQTRIATAKRQFHDSEKNEFFNDGNHKRSRRLVDHKFSRL